MARKPKSDALSRYAATAPETQEPQEMLGCLWQQGISWPFWIQTITMIGLCWNV